MEQTKAHTFEAWGIMTRYDARGRGSPDGEYSHVMFREFFRRREDGNDLLMRVFSGTTGTRATKIKKLKQAGYTVRRVIVTIAPKDADHGGKA